MTPHARKEAGGEQAPVIAPLAVLVSCALLVLAQLYLAITLAPVIREVLKASGRPQQRLWARRTRWRTASGF